MAGTVVAVIACLGLAACIGGEDTTRDESGAIIAEGDVGVFNVRVGDCFDAPTGTEVAELSGIPCDMPHDKEAFAVFEIDDGDFPGRERLGEQAFSQCKLRFGAYTGEEFDTQYAIAISSITPTKDSWSEGGDREVVCVLLDGNGSKLTGSKAAGAAAPAAPPSEPVPDAGSDEREWLNEFIVLFPPGDIGTLLESTLNECLGTAPASVTDYTDCTRLADQTSSEMQAVLDAIEQAPPPPSSGVPIQEGLEESLRLGLEGLSLLPALTEAEPGSLDQRELGLQVDRAFTRAQNANMAAAILVFEFASVEPSDELQDLLNFITANNLTAEAGEAAWSAEFAFWRAFENPDADELAQASRSAQSAFEDFSAALQGIPEPADDALAAALSKGISGATKVAESYGLAAEGYATQDEDLLAESDQLQTVGLTEFAEWTFEGRAAQAALFASIVD